MWKPVSTFVLGFVVSAVVLAAIPMPEPGGKPKIERVANLFPVACSAPA